MLPTRSTELLAPMFAAATICLSTAMAAAQAVPDSVSQIYLRTNALHENHSFNLSGNGSDENPYMSGSVDYDLLVDSFGNIIANTQVDAVAAARVTRKSIGLGTTARSDAHSSGTFYYGVGASGQMTASILNYFRVDHPALLGQSGTMIASIEVVASVGIGSEVRESGFTEGKSNVNIWATGLAPVHNNCSTGAPLCNSRYTNSLGTSSQEGGTVSGTHVLRIPFVFGSVGSIQMAAWAYSEAMALGYNNGATMESGSGAGVRWGGITEILDANGNPVQGWTVSSPADLALPAPEPGLAAMIAVGSVALAGAGQRSRRRSEARPRRSSSSSMAAAARLAAAARDRRPDRARDSLDRLSRTPV